MNSNKTIRLLLSRRTVSRLPVTYCMWIPRIYLHSTSALTTQYVHCRWMARTMQVKQSILLSPLFATCQTWMNARTVLLQLPDCLRQKYSTVFGRRRIIGLEIKRVDYHKQLLELVVRSWPNNRLTKPLKREKSASTYTALTRSRCFG